MPWADPRFLCPALFMCVKNVQKLTLVQQPLDIAEEECRGRPIGWCRRKSVLAVESAEDEIVSEMRVIMRLRNFLEFEW